MARKITVQATRRTEGKPQDMCLMVDGLKIARRGYPDTPEAGTWVPIEPGWEVKDVLGGDEIWVRYTNPVSGEVITFPEGGAPMTTYGYARAVCRNGERKCLGDLKIRATRLGNTEQGRFGSNGTGGSISSCLMR